MISFSYFRYGSKTVEPNGENDTQLRWLMLKNGRKGTVVAAAVVADMAATV